MKKAIGLFIFCIIGIQSYSQGIRSNKFHVPINGNEAAFVQLDSLQNATAANLYQYTKDWLGQTFQAHKLQKENKEKGSIDAIVKFKIDDDNIKDPLNYTATVSVDYKDGVARINLHNLSYTVGDGRNKKTIDVTYQIKEAVRAHTDELYPQTWDSLKKYGYQLLKNYKAFIAEKEKEQL